MDIEKNMFLFRDSLNKIIEETPLTISIIYYILKDSFKEIENLYYQSIQRLVNRIEENKEMTFLLKENPNMKIEVQKHE